MKKEIERIMGGRIVFACSYRIRRVAGVLCYKKDVDDQYRPLTSVALKELIVANKKYSRAIIAARKGRVEMKFNERKYEKWVKKGLEKAKDYAHKDRTEAGPITEFIRNIMEDAFYEGYMAAKEEKFHGKISVI
jgi:hypothetical protein